MECKVWSVKCGVESVECEVWSVKGGMCGMCGVYSVECKVYIAGQSLRTSLFQNFETGT